VRARLRYRVHLHISNESGAWAQVIVSVRSPAANADGRDNGLGRHSEVDADAPCSGIDARRFRDRDWWGEVGEKDRGKHKDDATHKSPHTRATNQPDES
jgi:hypothetical protein